MRSDSVSGEISYEVDGADRITAVSESWEAFALANHGGHLVAPKIVGSSLWSAISEPTTRALYRTLVMRVRAGGDVASFCFRCDSPSRRRELLMRIAARDDGIVSFTTSLVREQERREVALLDPAAERTEEIVVVCGWCARVKVGEGRWVEVEEAVRVLRLFELTALPQLSHGMCPLCSETFTHALDEHATRSPERIVVGALPPD